MSEGLEETTGSYRRILNSTGSFSEPSDGMAKNYLSSSGEGDISNTDLDNEVTPGSLEIWSDLPEEIKNDPSLAPFKSRYEKQFGTSVANSTLTGDLHTSKHDLTDTENHSENHNSSGATANGFATQHKCTSENNNIGSQPYFSNNLSLAEAGIPKSHPMLVRQNSDFGNYMLSNENQRFNQHRLSLGGDKTIFTKKTNPKKVHDQSMQPKVSFLSSNMLEGSAPIDTISKPPNPPAHNTDISTQDDTDAVTGHKKTKPWIRNTKTLLLLVCWIIFTAALLLKNEKVEAFKQISVPVNRSKSYFIFENPIPKKLLLKIQCPYISEQHSNSTNSALDVWIEAIQISKPYVAKNISKLDMDDIIMKKNSSIKWRIELLSDEYIDFPSSENSKIFDLEEFDSISGPTTLLRIMLYSSLHAITPVSISYNTKPINVNEGVMYASIVLMGLYVLIIFEIVHRTFAAILASTMSVAILAILDERPTTSQLISWIDVETLLLLFSMMVIVAILSETGIFDYLAVYAYKVTGGSVWPLINCLCLFTAVMSSFLDNVTTVLLMTPVTIRLCEVMELNPVPILMSMIIFSNIGGTLTPVGDPPNVIIASNSKIIEGGIDFTTFTMHMAIGILLVVVQTYIHIRFYFRNMSSLRHSEPQDVRELRHEISIWQRAAASLSSYSKDEDLVRVTLMKKVNRLLALLKKKMNSGKVGMENYKANLQELTAKYPIRNRVLLAKCAIAVMFVITFFFLHSIPELQRLSLGWTALLGAILLLILSDRNDMEAVLARVEWSTLLFFAALFILMEALSKLGLINWIGKQTELVIMSVSEESRLAVAILLILWVSAVASAFVDNIPLTTMMIRIATSLGNNPALNLPLQPLIWALAFGACLGGNGTLIGASANVVCAGVAEQHGYRFSFMEYFKIGFPVMLGSISVITGYLLVCHVVLQWH